MTSRLETEIRLANEVGDKMQDLIVAKGRVRHGDRNTLLMAYWSVIFEFHRSILCLLSYNFYGAAWSLARPTIEAAIRAHVVIIGSADDLKNIRADEYKTNFKKIGKAIDASVYKDNVFERFLSDTRLMLHSFSHVGTMQLNRRFSNSDLTENYPTEEIIALIRFSTSATFMVNNVVTKHLGFDEEWLENTRLFEEWAKHPN